LINISPCLTQETGEKHSTSDTEYSYEDYGEGDNTIIDFYQRWIAPVRGINKCPMYPSCSQYAKIAFSVLPWYKAYPMTLERLLRCGHELYLYPAIRINGEIRSYDPVRNDRSINEIEISEDSLESNFKTVSFDSTIFKNMNSHDNGFADYLFNQGEYYRAITEYYRLAYLISDSTKKPHFIRKIGLCYYYGTDYQGFISFVKQQDQYLSLHPDIHTELTLYLAKSYYQLNNYQRAISTLEWSINTWDDQFYNEKQFILGISYARIFEWQRAIEEFNFINDNYSRITSSQNIIQSLKNYDKLPQKSPALAGILSAIIPGSGYFYCNRKRTAISSFILNGIFALTIREAVIKKNYWLAGSVSFLGIGWYVGNIIGSKEAAHNYNANIRHKFIDRVLEIENYTEYMRK
jgi:tetratricopeptide (TPR) repeat protein